MNRDPRVRRSRRSGVAIVAAASAVMLGACSSGTSSAERTTVSKSTVENPYPNAKKLSAESRAIADEAQTGAEQLAQKIYDLYQKTPTKYTYTRQDRDGSPETVVGLDLDTGKQHEGWPVVLHANAVLDVDPSTGNVDPKLVKSLDVSFRRDGDDPSSTLEYYNFAMVNRDGIWNVDFYVDTNGISHGDAYISRPKYLSVAQNDISHLQKRNPMDPGQSSWMVDKAQDVLEGQIHYEDLARVFTLPVDG